MTRTLKNKMLNRTGSYKQHGGREHTPPENVIQLQKLSNSKHTTSEMWVFAEDRRKITGSTMVRRAFNSMKNFMARVGERLFMSHDQVIAIVLKQANAFQDDGYIVTDIYGSVATPTTRNKSNDLIDTADSVINYTIVYRKYKPGEKRATRILKVTRTGNSLNQHRLEKRCLKISNKIGEENIISRVMLSDIGTDEKMVANEGDLMFGRTRITIFYRKA